MCANVGEILECSAGRQHERDHRASEVFAERERTGHREDGDEIHTGLLVHDPGHDLPRDRHQPDRCSHAPDQVRRVRLVCTPLQNGAQHDSEERQNEQDVARRRQAVSHDRQVRSSREPTCDRSLTPSIATWSSEDRRSSRTSMRRRSSTTWLAGGANDTDTARTRLPMYTILQFPKEPRRRRPRDEVVPR